MTSEVKRLQQELADLSLTEQLSVTIDQRHFRLFRPKHCPVFDLLP